MNIHNYYASYSAAVYGGGQVFQETREYEAPLNVYGYSKFLFDEHVRRILPKTNSQIVGLRYFNVYGPKESHKGSMASVAFHLHNQLLQNGEIKLFAGNDGYADGEQRRDFIYIDDVVSVNLWFLENPTKSGIFNVGTGRSQSFNEVANAVINFHKRGNLSYIPFPEHLQVVENLNSEVTKNLMEASQHMEVTVGSTINAISKIFETYQINDLKELTKESVEKVQEVTKGTIKDIFNLVSMFHWKNLFMSLALTLVISLLIGLFINAEWPWEQHALVLKERKAGQILLKAWPHISKSSQTEVLKAAGR